MLGWRLIMSAVLIPLIAGFFWLDHRLGPSAGILLVFCCLVAVRSSWELCDLLRVRSIKPVFGVTATASLMVVCSAWGHVLQDFPSPKFRLLAAFGWMGLTLISIFCGLLVIEAVRFQSPGQSLESLGAHSLIVLYAGGLLAATAQLRWFPEPSAGYFVMASMIVCVKSGDIFAYTFGRLWGKRKLAPLLSPGKTWMGLAGAIFGSTLGGWLWIRYGSQLFDSKPVPAADWLILLYSGSLGLIGLAGDLCESLLKRDAGKKDSAALMPGFGGLLDLLDSPLFSGPWTVVWWLCFPPATFS